MKNKNTFGEYQFEDWVCEPVRDQIREFWGWAGRTHKDWIKASEAPYNFNGYPKIGQKVFVLRPIMVLGHKLYELKEGRFLYAWNNIGRLIHDDGSWSMVSSCDTFLINGKEVSC